MSMTIIRENIWLIETIKFLSFCWTRKVCIMLSSMGLQVFSVAIIPCCHACISESLNCSFCNEDVSLLVSEWGQRKMMSTYMFSSMPVFDLKWVWFWVCLDPRLLFRTIYKRKLISQSCSDIFKAPLESSLNDLLTWMCWWEFIYYIIYSFYLNHYYYVL